jgi:hypothetical protein
MAKTYRYRVTQTLDIEIGKADPVKAAELARKIQLDPLTEARFAVEMQGPCPNCHCYAVHRTRCSIAKKQGCAAVDLSTNVTVTVEYKDTPDAG